MNEDEKALIDVKRLLPQVTRRMHILGHMRKNWTSFIGYALSRHSKPYDWIKNDLYIAVDDKASAHILSNMKGNISRALANRYDYHEDIELKITEGETHKEKINTQPAKSNIKSKQAVNIVVNDDLVSEYISLCPDSMTSEAKFAMSHFMAYLESLELQGNKSS